MVCAESEILFGFLSFLIPQGAHGRSVDRSPPSIAPNSREREKRGEQKTSKSCRRRARSISVIIDQSGRWQNTARSLYIPSEEEEKKKNKTKRWWWWWLRGEKKDSLWRVKFISAGILMSHHLFFHVFPWYGGGWASFLNFPEKMPSFCFVLPFEADGERRCSMFQEEEEEWRLCCE